MTVIISYAYAYQSHCAITTYKYNIYMYIMYTQAEFTLSPIPKSPRFLPISSKVLSNCRLWTRNSMESTYTMSETADNYICKHCY